MAKKVGRKLVAFVALVTVGQLMVFNHYNSLFAAARQDTAAELKQSSDQQQSDKSIQQEVARLKAQNYKFVTVSQGNEYATYLDSSNILHIEDLASKKDVTTTKISYPVQYVSWIGDQKVFVGEQIAPGDLELTTVDTSDGSQSVACSFTQLSADAAFAKITFSTQTNDIYVLINTATTSALYHIGTMKDVSEVPIDGRYIKNIAISETGDKLYFEDRLDGSYNVLYFDSENVPHRVQLNAALVSVVGNVLYYGDIDSNGLVTSVYKLGDNGQSTLVSTLKSPTLAADIDIDDDGKIQINSSTA